MNLILRTISQPLVMSWISSETPKKPHSPNIHYTLALMHVKCVTLWVQECVDMIFINNQMRVLEIHTDSHTFNDDHIDWTAMLGFN
jgi:hypothetical protein